MKDHKADQDPQIWFVQKFRVETLGFDEKWASSSTSRKNSMNYDTYFFFLKEKVMFGSNNNSLRTSGGPIRSLSKKATQKIDILL